MKWMSFGKFAKLNNAYRESVAHPNNPKLVEEGNERPLWKPFLTPDGIRCRYQILLVSHAFFKWYIQTIKIFKDDRISENKSLHEKSGSTSVNCTTWNTSS